MSPRWRTAPLSLILITFCLFFISTSSHLSVSSRWIVDDSDGSRVKLACVNWASHLQPMFAEGLSKQPLQNITMTIRSMGFNCVRLTWATDLFTNKMLGRQTVRQSCTNLHLQNTLAGITVHNPDLLDLSLVATFERVVSSLGNQGLMVILDNHVSKPQWCCSDRDGNGFWGDEYFDPKSWMDGLSIVASTFKYCHQVVAMSLRNELRGPGQSVEKWYNYILAGAKAVHERNPKLLILLSGLQYDTDLQFLSTKQMNTSFHEKIAYEMHWYSSSYGAAAGFKDGNLNRVCASVTASVVKMGVYLTGTNKSYTAPVVISEFGADERGGNKANNRFLSCFMAFMAGGDLDWAYWPLQGSYYLRDGKEDDEEFYGVLNAEWDAPRNASFLSRLQALQLPWQATSTARQRPYQVLFHPASGLCLQKGAGNTLAMVPCANNTSKWMYTRQGRIALVGTYLCVAAAGEGLPARLEVVGTELNGPWSLVSEARMQLATKDKDGVRLCLDGSQASMVTTTSCVCVENKDCSSGADPSNQWFKLITTTIIIGGGGGGGDPEEQNYDEQDYMELL